MSRARTGLAALCVAATATAVVVTALGTGRHPVAAAVVQAFVVGVPCLVGMLRMSGNGKSRFARVLVGIGLGLALVALSASRHAVPYSIGRVAFWLLEPAIVVALLTLPSGRLRTMADRGVAACAVALSALLYVPTALVTVRFPQPVPWSSCAHRCPHNVFAVVSRQPPFVADVVEPLRTVLAAVLLVAVTAVVVSRTLRAQPLVKAALAPVAVAATLHLLTLAAYLVARSAGAAESALEPLGWAYQLSLPMLAIGFATGEVARASRGAQGLERLAHWLRSGSRVGAAGRAMALALGDPSLRLLRRSAQDEQWTDDAGRPVRLPEPGPDVAITRLAGGSGALAAVVHDPVLDEEPALVRAAAEIALLRLENDQLARRLLGVADRERRNIERSLHDGAQQGLVGLRIRLALLRDRLEEVAPDEVATVDELGGHVESALEQVRALARGIYPPTLSQQGLGPALRAAARMTQLPVLVDVDPPARYAPEMENAVYFTCMEAVQNAVKHASGATAVNVALRELGSELWFLVRDDGRGFPRDPHPGVGLESMRDRVSAAGGELLVASAPGLGTLVTGHVRARPAG